MKESKRRERVIIYESISPINVTAVKSVTTNRMAANLTNTSALYLKMMHTRCSLITSEKSSKSMMMMMMGMYCSLY